MRIIAGEYRSRLVKSPHGVRIRPTCDNVKEALFNILGQSIVGASFLDLYAGTGNVGIEALSRGAKSVVFVDNNPRCVKAMEDNLKSLGLLGLDKAQVRYMEAFKAIDRFKEEKIVFDFVFLDPPYYKDVAKKSLNYISDCAILQRDSFVLVEHYKKDELPEICGNLSLTMTRGYGDTFLSFYKVKA